MKVYFESRQELAPTIWQYDFRPERAVDFVPGQYVNLRLPGLNDDPRGAGRTLTMTSLPTDASLSFLLKIPQPHSPYKEVLSRLLPGAEAKIDDAMGDLILPKDPSQPLVFIAGGIGIASFVSMLRELLAKRQERPVFFFYKVRDRRERLFRELTDAYPLALNMLTVSPNRLTARQIKDATPPDALIYMSGSQPFVEGLREQFETLGTPRAQIIFDYFDGYAEL